MSYRSFRFRLMAIFVLGMILLALTSTLSNGWTLAQVRDRASMDSSQALRQQAVETLQRQAQRRGDTTSQALTSIKLISSTAADLLAQNLLGGRANPDLIFSSSPDGWRYQQGTTTVLVPPDAGQLAGVVIVDIDSRLLGARMMLVGVTPEVAQTLVGLGIPTHDIQTSADIQSAIALVLAQGARRSETAAL